MLTAVDLSSRSRELLAGKVPFVEATVVRAQVPSSVRPGARALVLSDGSIEGFVGGQCAQGSVRSVALEAIRDGHSVLLRVLPEKGEPFPEAPGAHVVVNPCLSGGALEIFLQPRLPDPVIGVFGESPIVAALEELARPLGFVVEPAGDPTDVQSATAVVLATHGGDEASIIRNALDAGVGFVGLVASRRRGAAVLETLDLNESERERVHTPVGLDIGANTAPEIALSILAEITGAIRLGGLTAPAGPAPHRHTPPEPRTEQGAESMTEQGAEPQTEPMAEHSPPVMAVDPVCGMTVTVGPATPHWAAEGREHWFCGPGCRDKYAAGV